MRVKALGVLLSALALLGAPLLAHAGYPEGIRYRLAWIRHGEKHPAVLYDNHARKGHHRHVAGREGAYEFLDPDRLRADFLQDVSRMRGGRR